MLQLELGGGGGCCLRSLRLHAMDGLEGETRGDAAAGLELARTSRPGLRGASAAGRLCSEVPALADTRGGAGRRAFGSGDPRAARRARCSASPCGVGAPPRVLTPARPHYHLGSFLDSRVCCGHSVSLVGSYYLCKVYLFWLRFATSGSPALADPLPGPAPPPASSEHTPLDSYR